MAEKSKEEIIGRPLVKYELDYEDFGQGVERFYFWLLDQMKNKGYEPNKTLDVFTSSEASSFWAEIESRKAIQQDRASQYIRGVSEMLKGLFQIVREIRIMKERLKYYEDSKKGDKSAEIALKSIWIDVVEGGVQAPNSVLGLSQTVGFVPLPELFFNTEPKFSKDVDKEVNKLKAAFSDALLNVLRRKLKQYLIWKENTEKELNTKLKFTLKYLAQHFHTIKMYLNWIRPYLKNVKKLQMTDTGSSVDILTASGSGARLELELFGKKELRKRPVGVPLNLKKDKQYRYNHVFPCLKIYIKFNTAPQMAYQEGRSRGAIHLGITKIELEAYALSEEKIKKYLEKELDDDMDALACVDSAIEAMKEEIIEYLKEAEDMWANEKTKNKDKTNKVTQMLNPIKVIDEKIKNHVKTVQKFIGPSDKKLNKIKTKESKDEEVFAKKEAKDHAGDIYIVLKKSFGMLSW